MKRSRPRVHRRDVWMRVKDRDLIRRLRKQNHYSQQQLGFLVRKTQQSISQIESGELKNISEGFAIALAGRLGREWEELFEACEESALPAVTSDVHSSGDKVPA
ncbi:transcriptional regulator [Rhodococcus sp. 15-1154-1]|nr:transcriptional regulator [Rhodococcus sp. 15-1154-1]